MTNQLVGEVYLKIIEDVVDKSRIAFEEFGVATGTLEELQTEWKSKLSQRGAAVMPWDPKPVQQAPAQAAPAPPSNVANGMPPNYAQSYDTPPSAAANPPRVKQESGSDNSFGGLPNGPNGYPQQQPPGGAVRAAQLMQQQYGQAASASVNAMQRGGGLALPGGQQAKPQGLHLPQQSPPPGQPQYSPQQQQAVRQQQQQLQQQQAQSRIKVENDSPQLDQGSFPHQNAQPNYGQTDGAGDAEDAMEQWQTMLAQRRAQYAEQGQYADRMMREQIMAKSAELESGLMMPLDELPSTKRLKRSAASKANQGSSSGPSIPQLDGVGDDEDEEKPDIKDEDDENAINSDLDDSDDDGAGEMGDEDDDNLDSILCTYDKVQRVKNKWKCTLKDGIMSANGKEWVFHKGMGEFEW